MTYPNTANAASTATVIDVRNRIMSNPDRNILRRLEDLAEIDRAGYDQTGPRNKSFGQLMRMGLGAAFGVGLARGVGKAFGVGPSFQNSLDTFGLGMGAIMKSANVHEVRAFRIGFMKAAFEHGLLPKKAAMIAAPMVLTPQSVLNIPRSITGAGISAARGIGAGLGAIGADDRDDLDEGELEAVRDRLRQQLAEVRSTTVDKRLREVLAQRGR